MPPPTSDVTTEATLLPAGKERGASADLPDTARRILDAAKRLLAVRGIPGIRFDAIAAESGANKSMIRYYFGSKDGLVAALVDDLTHDATLELVDMAREARTAEDRVAAHFALTRRLLEDPSFKCLFDILAVALRRPALKEVLADLWEWYREVNTLCFGGPGKEQDPELRALSSLFMATIDGLAIQVAINEEQVDLDMCWGLLSSMMKTHLETHGQPVGEGAVETVP